MDRRLFLLPLFGLLTTTSTTAQIKQESFEDFEKRINQQFDDFKNARDKEFMEFLRTRWTDYELAKPKPVPVKPKPVKPTVADPKAKNPKPEEIPVGEVVNLPAPPSKAPATPVQPTVPAKPETPAQPATPVKPTVPAKPVTPATPVKPATPAKPEKPAQPAKPTQPAKPEKPTSPAVPVQPASPVSPAVPSTPVASPTSPVAPVVAAIDGPTLSKADGMKVDYYGTSCYVDNRLTGAVSLSKIDENAIADAWGTVCTKDYEPLVKDCQTLRKEMKLTDWDYYLLCRDVSRRLAPGDKNTQVFWQMFILVQSGYKARLARIDDPDRLSLMLAIKDQLYAKFYFELDGDIYYLLDDVKAQSLSVATYDKNFAGSKDDVKMVYRYMAKLKAHRVQRKWEQGGIQLTVNVDENKIKLMKDYPQCNFDVYYAYDMDEKLQKEVLPVFEKAIKGKSEKQAVQTLLTFVQKAFAYATDDEQFGYEKPFFLDEMLYYPKDDCEDRSIFFSYLVRSLLGLDVVYLEYPGHLATAVCFTDPNVSGTYLMQGGKKYVVCDPTYIGASIGMQMPMFNGVSPKMLKY